MQIRITKNESNTLHVWMGEHLIADSTTFRRTRGFWNKVTQTHIQAPQLTPKKVKQDPSLIRQALHQTGTTSTLPIHVDF